MPCKGRYLYKTSGTVTPLAHAVRRAGWPNYRIGGNTGRSNGRDERLLVHGLAGKQTLAPRAQHRQARQSRQYRGSRTRKRPAPRPAPPGHSRSTGPPCPVMLRQGVSAKRTLKPTLNPTLNRHTSSTRLIFSLRQSYRQSDKVDASPEGARYTSPGQRPEEWG